MQIALVEDTTADAHHLIHLLNTYYEQQNEKNQSLQISVFKNFDDFRQAFLNKHFDLVFLDIFLNPEDNGYQIATRIRNSQHNSNVPIIFTSSSRDYAVESYDVAAVGYLIKPISMESLKNCLTRLYTLSGYQKPTLNEYIRVLSNRLHVQVPIKNIFYIVANGNGSSIVLTNNTVETSMSIKALQELLDSPDFIIAKRGHLINMNHVKSATEDSFVMEDSACIPLKVKQRREILNLYKEFVMKNN